MFRFYWHSVCLFILVCPSLLRQCAACLASVGNSKTGRNRASTKKEYKCYIQPVGSFCLIKDLFCPTPLLSTDQYRQPPPCYSCRSLQVAFYSSFFLPYFVLPLFPCTQQDNQCLGKASKLYLIYWRFFY